LVTAAAFSLALPISLLALAMDSNMAGPLFGVPLLAATCASIVAWQGAKRS
jgi:hypothetical protein